MQPTHVRKSNKINCRILNRDFNVMSERADNDHGL